MTEIEKNMCLLFFNQTLCLRKKKGLFFKNSIHDFFFFYQCLAQHSAPDKKDDTKSDRKVINNPENNSISNYN